MKSFLFYKTSIPQTILTQTLNCMTQELTEQKSKLQNEMSDYLNEKGNLALQWATGVGKSRVAVNAVMDLFDQYGEEFRVLIVVAEDDIRTHCTSL